MIDESADNEIIIIGAARQAYDRAKLDLTLEEQMIIQLIKDCRKEKVSLPKNYWHKLHVKKQKVKALEALLCNF